MDYRLRRQPDGSVNAMPGDAVEVWDNCEWVSATYSGVAKTSDKVVIEMYLLFEHRDVKRYYDLEHVRHARGGAGWHRLREARLRAVVDKLLDKEKRVAELATREDNESPDYWRGVNSMMYVIANSARAALADLDNAEPEA
jgi:hypothetical protein